jgi:exopolyphosphatase / guanosine-5'-triphosphate,3'-diphosphate pyrophosphatase
MRLAAIDVGTNTALLLIADVGPGTQLAVVHDEERFVRLGQGVDASGVLAPEAIERVMAALHDYARLAADLGAQVVALAGTSASRDAANRQLLVDRVARELDLTYEVLSGDEEALLAFRGALAGAPELDRAAVLDVGGGSTEVVSGPASGEGIVRASFDVGAVRLTERHFPELPPGAAQVAAADAALAAALAPLAPQPGLPLIGAAGTVAALARLANPAHPLAPLALDEVARWRRRLLAMTADQIRALDPPLLAGRADVFAAGVMVVEAVMRRLGSRELQPSLWGLRHGLLLRSLERDARP